MPEVNELGSGDGRVMCKFDISAAVGPEDVVLTQNNDMGIVVWDKAMTTKKLDQSWPTFWNDLSNDVGNIGSGCYDGVITYDTFGEQFAFVQILSDGDTLLFAFSKSSTLSCSGTPSDDWYFGYLNIPAYCTVVDRPTIGFNKNWVCVVAPTWGNGVTYTRIIVFPRNAQDKIDAYTVANPSVTEKLASEFSTLASPVACYDDDEEDLFFMHDSFAALPYGEFIFHRLTGNRTTFTVETNILEVPGETNRYLNNYAPQPDGLFVRRHPNGLKCVQRNGFLWYVCQDNLGGVNGTGSSVVYKLDPWSGIALSDPSVVKVDEWLFVDLTTPPIHIINSALCVNKNNDVIIGFTGSSTGTYPSAYYGFIDGDTGKKYGMVEYMTGTCTVPHNHSLGFANVEDYNTSMLEVDDEIGLWTAQWFSVPMPTYPLYQYPANIQICKITPNHHAADTDRDWTIDGDELDRVFDMYEAGSYHHDNTTPDGYDEGSGVQDCVVHDSDYANGGDWAIDDQEFLRTIQLSNAADSYHYTEEDIYSPDNYNTDTDDPTYPDATDWLSMPYIARQNLATDHETRIHTWVRTTIPQGTPPGENPTKAFEMHVALPAGVTFKNWENYSTGGLTPGARGIT